MPPLPEWDDPDRRDDALRRIARRLSAADPLNRNELAVLFLASHGVPQGLIAEWLHLASSSVPTYAKKARAKLFAADMTHAVATALRLGLIS